VPPPGGGAPPPPLRQFLERLSQAPGLNIQELSDATGISRTAANYHVRRLVRGGYLVTLRQGPHLLHFPATVPPLERVAIGLLRIASVRATADAVFHHPALSWDELATRLHVTSRTVRRAIRALDRAGLLRIERENGTRQVHLHPALRLLLARQAPPA
jgi:predicted transcriptional regulator